MIKLHYALPLLVLHALGLSTVLGSHFGSEPAPNAPLRSQLPQKPTSINAVPVRYAKQDDDSLREQREWELREWQHRKASWQQLHYKDAGAPVAIRPFRVVTTASVVAVYALLAWRAYETFPANPLTMFIVAANIASCFMAFSRASRYKRLLKGVLAVDLCLEGSALLGSLLKLLLPSTAAASKDYYFASAISSFWFLLIALTCLRSNWISNPPTDAHVPYQYNRAPAAQQTPPPYAPQPPLQQQQYPMPPPGPTTTQRSIGNSPPSSI